jgi:hypothetical protein
VAEICGREEAAQPLRGRNHTDCDQLMLPSDLAIVPVGLWDRCVKHEFLALLGDDSDQQRGLGLMQHEATDVVEERYQERLHGIRLQGV